MQLLRIASIVVTASIASLWSCKDSSAPMERPGEAAAIAYDLGPNAKVCGDLVSLHQIEGAVDAPRPVTFQVAVCGHYHADEPSTEWKALGATLVTDKVRLVSANGDKADDGSMAALFVAADGTLSARRSSNASVTLGRAESNEEGAIVTLGTGVRMELIADGKAFDLKNVSAWQNAKERFVQIYLP